MKKTHILAIVVIAVAIGAIFSTLYDASTYADFGTAFAAPGKEFHVVGFQNREKDQVYDPVTNPDLFTFYMTDTVGVEKKVYLHRSRPADFDMSDRIVLIGKAKEDVFHATDILLKCPSKYEEEPGGTELGEARIVSTGE